MLQYRAKKNTNFCAYPMKSYCFLKRIYKRWTQIYYPTATYCCTSLLDCSLQKSDFGVNKKVILKFQLFKFHLNGTDCT